MKWIILSVILFFIFCVTFGVTLQRNAEYRILILPDGFLMGVAVSALQTEGAWNESGKSETIWDHYTHTYPEKITDGSNVDVATDFYHKYKEDIQLVKDIGFNTFRFSISWSRIFPSGYAVDPNEDGLRFYHNVLDELKRQGITPFVTLHHFDHPQVLEDQLNGWLNESMAYAFADYAKFVFREYGSKVKYFTTINEPQAFCKYFYPSLVEQQNVNSDSFYVCIHNLIKAHALAYRIYDKEFRHKQNGQVGIVQPCSYFYNVDDNDTLAQEIAFEFFCGIVSNPIFSRTGDYPDLVKKRVAERSKALGLKKSKLPVFTKKWINKIRGSSDYFGLNHYTSFLVKSLPVSEMQNWTSDEGIDILADPTRPSSQISVMKIIPEGFRKILKTIKKRYNNPNVFVTESGVSDGNGINDNMRIKYTFSYVEEMLKAIKIDKCNVKALFLWSLLDNFEFNGGYTIKYGLVHVDFKDKNLKRSLKKSAKWLKLGFHSRKQKFPLSLL